MPIKTNLNQPPYNDDYTYEKDYYAVLYKPGVSVQAREMNEDQAILRKQIELFGDNIITKGSIVHGCNFGFHSNYHYIKIRDNEIDGSPVTPLNWINYFAESEATGLTATIVNALEGFESGTDTNTLYIKYTNSGNDYTANSFAANQIIKIRTPNEGISSVDITNGGVGFSNNDAIVVIPAMVVSMTVGTITESSYIQMSGGANVQVVEVDSTTLADEGKLIVRVVPLDTHLDDTEPNYSNWEFDENETITNVGATIAGTVDRLLGSGLTASIITSGTGVVTDVVIAATGRDYTSLPTIRIASAGNSTGLAALDLQPKNFVARVRVINRVDAIGAGYAFSVTGGVTYFRGLFLRVSPQTLIVGRYTTEPDQVAAGFSATEEIINSNIDPDLLDNAIGEDNENAPGADRLKITPVLELRTIDDAATDESFFSLCEWSEGRPYKQQQLTNYSKIGDHMSQTTKDQSGDFVLDQFNITTRSPIANIDEGRYVSIVVDPGVAYIGGRKIETFSNYVLNVDKGINTQIDLNRRVSLNYGNYIRVSGVGGTFNFKSGAKIRFRTTAKSYYTSADIAAGTMTEPTGTSIGTARVRCMLHETGVIGTSSAIYRMYLFDINILAGQSFSASRSVWAIDSPNGVADIVTELDGTGNTIAVIKDPQTDRLLFNSGSPVLKNANNITYQYRTINTTAFSFASNGTAVFDISAITDELFPYAGSLTDSQMRELYVIPQATLFDNVSATGTLATDSSNAITGSGSSFLTVFQAGDFIYIGANSVGGHDLRQITSVTNNTHLRVHAVVSFTNAAASLYRAFPENVPVPFGYRTGLTANTSANGSVLYVHLNRVLDAGDAASIAVNIERSNVSAATKTIRRKHFVKLNLSSHDAGTTGPWCLGVPDVFRLRNVYVGGSTVNTTSSALITDNFYFDHNQNSNFLNLSFLYKTPKAHYSLSSSEYLLVEFDYFVRSDTGIFDTVSYTHSANSTEIFINDSLDHAALTSDANYFEIPDVLSSTGTLYDLKNHFDARPIVANTVTTSATEGSAPSNPAYAVTLPSVDFKFPNPDSILECVLETWKARIDNVYIDKDGRAYVVRGEVGRMPALQSGAMLLDTIEVPPYPGLPVHPSLHLSGILNTRVGNEKISYKTKMNHLVKPSLNASLVSTRFQPRRFSMREIGALERRIKDLEYYTSISSLNKSISDSVIPSSIDASINRFKYGFFIDEFNSGHGSDTANPQYSVEMVSSRIYPSKLSLPVYGDDIAGSFPYIDHEIIRQVHATESGLSPNCVPNTEYAVSTAFRREANSVAIGNSVSSFVDVFTGLTLSNVAAPIVLYFDTSYSSTKIEVYQNGSLVRTSNDAVVLTTADINKLTANNIPGNFFTTSDLDADVEQLGNFYVRRAGKIAWSHDPTSGRNYEIRTSKGSGGRVWKYMLEYPIDGASVGCVIDEPVGNTVDPVDPVDPPGYEGTMTITGQIEGESRYLVMTSNYSASAGGE